MSNNDKNQSNRTPLQPGDQEVLLDHDYDGIQELDHPLPRWWLWMFYLTIVFSAVYVGYYMTGIGPGLRDELKVAMAEIDAKRPKPDPAAVAAAQSGAAAQPDPATLEKENGVILAAIKDSGKLAKGKEVYVGKCAACHGANGEGGIGPNLTDDHWIHGKGQAADIAATVRIGVTDKGMPPWADMLAPDDLISVVAFVKSVRGTNPPGAKAPQGEKFESKEL